MNKIAFIIIFLAVGLGYVFDLHKPIVSNFTFFNSVKEFYIKESILLSNTIDKYFNQAQNIEELSQKVKRLEKYKLLFEDKKVKLENISKNLKYINENTSNVSLVKVLSYVNLDDFTRVWLDMPKKNENIAGLIIDDFAAGIVIEKDNKAQALLNGHEKANYAVFIGENKAPGIIHSIKKKRNILAKYVPIWIDVKLGDEVITSGMDNIFFEGLKVGKVVNIKKLPDMQEIEIQPYANVLKQRFFLVYEKPITKQKEEIKKKAK